MATTAPLKDAITCHVLDTVCGRPATGISVTLEFNTSQLGVFPNSLIPKSPLQLGQIYTFAAKTNADGRITNWDGLTLGVATIGPIVDVCKESGKPMAWTLNFDTGKYYGEGKTFWPEVQLKFWVQPGESYHVPLLLGPWSYTTYRGS